MEFGEDDPKVLAGAGSLERGLGYPDAVCALDVGEGSVTAVVHGTDVHEVELTLGGGDGISGWCDRPYGHGSFSGKAATDQGPRPALLQRRRQRARTRSNQASRSLTISFLLVSWNSSWRAAG